jgi:hypothetical protein
MNTTEKREHPRIKVRWPVAVLTAHDIIHAETRNITVNGLFICCEDLLPLDSTFPMNIIPPNRQPLEVSGKVVWSDHYTRDEQDVPYGMGMCFVKVSEEDRHTLEELLFPHPI